MKNSLPYSSMLPIMTIAPRCPASAVAIMNQSKRTAENATDPQEHHFTLLCEACLAFSEEGKPSPWRDRSYSQRKLLTQVSGEAYFRFDQVMQETLEGQCLFSAPQL